MPTRFLHESTRAAYAAASSQQEQCEIVRSAFQGNVTVRIEGAAGQHLRTMTLGPFTINSLTPRGVVCGSVLADTAVAPNTPGAAGIAPVRWEFRSGSTPIFDTDDIVQGPIRTLCQPRFGSVVFTANPALPVVLLPAWRTAMTATDTLYYVGTAVPYDAPALAGMPTQFGSSGTAPDNFGAGWDVMTGYSSGTLIEGLGGAFGSMVYGTGGHTRLQNQILRFDLNQNSPTFSWWQQPTWKTSDTGGANLYYSPTEESALVAGPRGTAARIRLDTNETADAAAWDRQFPVAANGWIFPRKLTTGQMGDGVPHGYRYSATCYLSTTVTGGDPLYLAVLGPQGPFAQDAKPAGVTDAEWFDAAVLSGGNRRWPYHLKNVTTGAWSVHQWQPAGLSIGGFGATKTGVFTDQRRVYVCASTASTHGWYFLDFSAGFAGHTVSTYTGSQLGIGRYASGAWSDGDPLGRHFAIFQSDQSDGRLVVYNFDTSTSFYVDLAGQGYSHDPNDEYVGTSYDAANKRMFIVRRNITTWDVGYWVITVPDTLTNTGSYTATFRTLSLSDPAMETTHFNSSAAATYFYNKTKFHPGLGVILVPFGQLRMLAFRPS